MNNSGEIKTLSLIYAIRRATRILRQVEEQAIEEDLKQKFGQFAQEHTEILESLKKQTDLDAHDIQETPQSLIQFPIDRQELFQAVAKAEKQIVKEVNRLLGEQIPPKAKDVLKKNKPKLVASYDYVQALHDLIV